ncbi:hypothetical protein [Wolbachia endosymbiont of Operophtera brumata]|uniref:hypothetical protein n=1 Tax=Wolbachia endosymbiont of Operophtera brumata TaxID=1620420 RepID=UPI00068A8269|nr:hypothetical protein [Wolbachia endosymbiont of Operophtera brumata]
MASLTFKDNSGGNVPSPNIKSIIYEDAAQNKYTFGVDNATNVFNTFKYEPNGAAEIDYSATATKFMTGGAIATLLGIGTNVDAIKTKTDSIPADLSADLVTIKTQVGTDLISGIKAKTDKITDTLGADVTAIKAKTDKMPADLGTELGNLAKSAELAPLAKSADVTAIKAKTDTIPADLTAKVTAIETATNSANLGDKVTAIQTKTDKITDTLGADVTAIKAKTDKMPADLGTELGNLAKSADVTAIKAKTDTIPADLTAKVTAIETATNSANLGDKVTAIQTKTDKITDTLGADVTAIKAKTDKMPADLNAELIKLTTIGNAINGNGNVTEAAKAVLESSFKKAIKEAGEDGSEWLKNEIKEIVSQPSFEIPTDSSSPLSWDW